jgi:hypothetical protein
MPRLKLVMLDANVIIKLHELELWDKAVASIDIHLAQTVVDEAHFWIDATGEKQEIDLHSDIEANRITVFEMDAVELASFLGRFDAVYRPEIDPGELESIAWMEKSHEEYLFSSADLAVYRVLGLLGRGEQGISLEELLQRIGKTKQLEPRFSKAVRENFTKQGKQDKVRGRGLKSGDP